VGVKGDKKDENGIVNLSQTTSVRELHSKLQQVVSPSSSKADGEDYDTEQE
jgi:hypothetical protein